jgi:predicted nucleic acid-binding protein
VDIDESESVILYEELQADYLLIDDSKARLMAESLNINCIGTLGLLLKAKEKGFISELRPIFERLNSDGRFYSIKLLNDILIKIGE